MRADATRQSRVRGVSIATFGAVQCPRWTDEKARVRTTRISGIKRPTLSSILEMLQCAVPLDVPHRASQSPGCLAARCCTVLRDGSRRKADRGKITDAK